MQGPPQVFKISIIQEVFRVRFQPHAQLLNTSRSDIRKLVAVTVHKHTAERGIHHGRYLLPVLPQLKHIHMRHRSVNMHNQDCEQISCPVIWTPFQVFYPFCVVQWWQPVGNQSSETKMFLIANVFQVL